MTQTYRGWTLNVNPCWNGEGLFADAGEGEHNGGYIRSDGMPLDTEEEAIEYLRSQVDIVISYDEEEARQAAEEEGL